jgi:hypothetical protein
VYIKTISSRFRRLYLFQGISLVVRKKRGIAKNCHIYIFCLKYGLRQQLVTPPQNRLIPIFSYGTGHKPRENVPGTIILS